MAAGERRPNPGTHHDIRRVRDRCADDELVTNEQAGTQFPNQREPQTQFIMSFAGPVRNRGAMRAASSRHRPPEPVREVDWMQVAIFGAGLALGITVGAGVALLTAPQSGTETRADLARKARRTRTAVGRRGNDAWLELRDELRGMTRSLQRRKAQRAAERELARESALD